MDTCLSFEKASDAIEIPTMIQGMLLDYWVLGSAGWRGVQQTDFIGPCV